MSDVADVHDVHPTPKTSCLRCEQALLLKSSRCPACGTVLRASPAQQAFTDRVSLMVIAVVSVAAVTGILLTVAG